MRRRRAALASVVTAAALVGAAVPAWGAFARTSTTTSGTAAAASLGARLDQRNGATTTTGTATTTFTFPVAVAGTGYADLVDLSSGSSVLSLAFSRSGLASGTVAVCSAAWSGATCPGTLVASSTASSGTLSTGTVPTGTRYYVRVTTGAAAVLTTVVLTASASWPAPGAGRDRTAS